MYRYERFKFSYADTPEEAYKKECKNYQDFGGDKGKLINDRYPQAPDYDETSSSSSGM